MEEIGNTSLTRKEYTKKVNQWISDNPDVFEQIKKETNNKPWPEIQKRFEPELGKVFWTEVKGNPKLSGLVPKPGEGGFNFRLENKGNNKGGFKSFETRKETRGIEFRRASLNEQTLSIEDYLAYAEKSGGKYTPLQAENLYKINQNKLRLLRRHKGTVLPSGPLIAYEHLIPTTSQTYGGVEHYRNIVLMDEASNLKKSDYMILEDTARKAGIPLSKEQALQMDFEGTKDLPPKQKRQLVGEDLTSRVPQKARELNKQLNNGNGNGNGNGKVNGKVNGKKNGFSTLKKAGVGTALISSASFLPSVEAAEQTQELIENKEYKQAAITYGKDLIVGDVKGRAALKAFTSTSNFLARKGVSKIARRKLIQIAGRQLAKKGIALAAGPAAPMLLTALLIKDVYDVANVVSKGRLNQAVGNAFSNKNNTVEKAQSLNLNSI